MEELLKNTLKYVPSGCRVEINATRLVEGVRIRVVDNGDEFSPESLATLGNPFTRAPGHQDVPSSSGLGLAIVDGIARNSGGSLTLDANKPRGLVVEILLPGPARPPANKVVTRAPTGSTRALPGAAALYRWR
ncbi:sensor histidine kinase [Candidatus Protofrankia californiensis]|uniref:sensor histidine kinase n=1 Tax=Candidatus Protofrankia californiensis TaxID=1839754 RepID=UPI003D356665